MRGFRQACIVTALVAVGPALASAQEMKAEVIHWWTSGGESAAVKVFADAFTAAGGTWIDSAVAGGENARTAGINRIVGGDPPTAMQFNTGLQFDEIVGNGFLRDLEALAEKDHWRDVLLTRCVNVAASTPVSRVTISTLRWPGATTIRTAL